VAWRLRAVGGGAAVTLEAAARPAACGTKLAAAPACGNATRFSKGARPTPWRLEPARGRPGLYTLAAEAAPGCAARPLAAKSLTARCTWSALLAGGRPPTAWRLARAPPAGAPPPPATVLVTTETVEVRRGARGRFGGPRFSLIAAVALSNRRRALTARLPNPLASPCRSPSRRPLPT
jgi:hypothetical protein